MRKITLIMLMCLLANAMKAQTILNRGDLAVVGINAALRINNANTNKDEISFVCFKDITSGTEIQITDNGYGTCVKGQWSSIEGGAKLRRTGTTIPAGTIITFRNQDTLGGLPAIYFTAPDNNWQVSDLSPIVTAAGFNLNSNGDQIFFAQGGVWTSLSTNCTASSRTAPNADYPGVTGRMLYGFSTSGVWKADGSSQESDPYPGLTCFSMAPTTASNYVKYDGSLATKSQVSWIAAISNVNNWGSYTIDNYATKAPLWGTTVKNITISSNDIPNPEWTAPSQPLCKNSLPIDLRLFITGTTGGTWSGIGVSGNNFNPAGLNAGKYYITYSVNYISGGNSCPVSKVDSIIIADDATISYGNASLCKKNGTISVIRTGLAGGTFTAGAGLSINSTTGEINLGTSTPGSYVVSYTYGTNPCNGIATANVTINDVATPSLEESQPPTCLLTGTVTVTSPTSGVTYSSDGVNFQTSNVFAGLTPGQTYTITVKNASGCTASANITISPQPTAPTAPVLTPIQPTCTVPTGTITVTPQPGLVTYSISADGGTTYTPQPTNVFSNLAPGKYTIRVTNAAGCINETSITIDAVPGAPSAPIVNPSVNYCQNATPIALTATGTGLLWYTTVSGGTGSATAPTPTTSTVGNTDFFVSQVVGGCESPRSKITVTINAAPAPPAVTTPQTVCQNAPAPVLTATGNNLLWFATVNATTGSSTVPTVSTVNAGNFSFFVSQTVNGCESPKATIIIIVTATPANPVVVSPVSYCQNATATALTATGTNLLWYTAANGGSGSSTSPTPIVTTVGTVPYYVSQTVNGCESGRSTINVTVNAIPTAPTVTSPINACQNASAPTLSAVGSGLLWYATATSLTGSTSAPSVTTSNAGQQNYFVSQTVNGCESPRASITVNIIATPTATIIYPGNPFTNVAATVLPTITGTQGGTFTVNPISGLSINTQTGAINTGTSRPGTYTVTYQFSANGCNGVATTSVTINTTNTEIFIPNTFTPNGDSKNDVFLIYGNSIQSIDMKVFNQWGQVVFETNSQLKGWDGTIGGKKQPSGVYIYAAKIILIDGTTITKKGSINLIR